MSKREERAKLIEEYICYQERCMARRRPAVSLAQFETNSKRELIQERIINKIIISGPRRKPADSFLEWTKRHLEHTDII